MGFIRTAAQELQIQEAFELCSARLQNGGGFIKAKTARLQLHELFIKNYNWSWQEVRMLVK